ncbi:hypothetical protein D5086_006391 [Populus alba]|uniref:Uncharacterized protein n=1 Tax=Populus alba TaxID=43335 RepID=A0ACC4CMK7_POPAL
MMTRGGGYTVTRPQQSGGLVIRETRSANVSLLGKLIWHLLQSWKIVGRSPSAQICKYFDCSFIHMEDSWHLSTLNTDFPEELKHRIIAIPISRTVHSEHKWRWLWRLRVPEKIRNLFWLVFHGSLPTASLMGARNLASTAICKRCQAANEDTAHCNLEDMHCSQLLDHMDIVERITVMADSDNGFLFLAALWWIWRQRNCFVLGELYKGDVWLLRNIYCAAADFHLAWTTGLAI